MAGGYDPLVDIARRLDRIESASDRQRTDFSTSSVAVSNIGIILSQVQKEIAEEKAARINDKKEIKEAIEEVHGDLDTYIRSQVTNRKTAFYSGYLPSILALIAIASTVFLTLWGSP